MPPATMTSRPCSRPFRTRTPPESGSNAWPNADDDQRLLDLIQLAMVPGVGPHISRALLERFGSAGQRPGSASRATARALRASAPRSPRRSASSPGLRRGRRTGFVPRRGVSLIARGDPRYPPPLENIPDPPGLLYVKGAIEPAISSPSPWSARGTARRTACGWPSGCRRRWRGPVSRSSRDWLAASTRPPTVARSRPAGERSACSPTGWRRFIRPSTKSSPERSPWRGPWSARCRCGKGHWPACSPSATGSSRGCRWVCSSSRQRRAAGRFRPRRTRWSRIARSSPSPGPADSLSSRGCHRLIRDGARLVETVDDILEELGPLVQEVRTDPEEPPVRHPAELALSDSERSLLGRLDDQPTAVDDLIALHRHDRRPGHGHAQRARAQTPGQTPARTPVRAGLMSRSYSRRQVLFEPANEVVEDLLPAQLVERLMNHFGIDDQGLVVAADPVEKLA